MYGEHKKKVSFNIDKILRDDSFYFALNKWDSDLRGAINADLDDEDYLRTERYTEFNCRYSSASMGVIINLLVRVSELKDKLIRLSDDDRG